MASHASSSHPPTEKECPPKHLMQEVDHILLGKAVIGLEYTYKVCIDNKDTCMNPHGHDVILPIFLWQ